MQQDYEYILIYEDNLDGYKKQMSEMIFICNLLAFLKSHHDLTSELRDNSNRNYDDNKTYIETNGPIPDDWLEKFEAKEIQIKIKDNKSNILKTEKL